jgi:hypothetical protein
MIDVIDFGVSSELRISATISFLDRFFMVVAVLSILNTYESDMSTLDQLPGATILQMKS